MLLESSGGGPEKPVGRVALFNERNSPHLCSNFFRALRPDPKEVDPAFLAWRLQKLWRSSTILALQQQTTGIINLKFADYLNARLSIPPLPEQRAIAAVLDTLDDAIQKTEQLIAKLKQVKQGLLHDLLTRGIDDNGELRDPGRHPEQFQDSPLGRIPKSWRCRTLESCTRNDAPITYGIVQAGAHVECGIPYVRTGDMAGDELLRDGMLCTSPRIAASYARSRIEAGEIVCAIRATVGKVLPVPAVLDGANLTQGTARIAPSRDVDPAFLIWALRGHAVQRQFDLFAKGTTFKEITLAQLRRLSVALPEQRHEQEQIGRMLESCWARIGRERATQRKLVHLKAGVAEDLLTGHVCTTSLIEVAA